MSSLHIELGPYPRQTKYSKLENRPGYHTVNASEFCEEEEVLREKIQLLASLLRESKECIAYTGAGISTSAGIPDYATKKEGEESEGPSQSLLLRQPTLSHRVLVSLYRRGILKHWVKNNVYYIYYILYTLNAMLECIESI